MKKTKSTKNIKSAPALRDGAQYINSAGVKLPNADLIIEADASGAVTSCRDAVTGTEYVGGGGSDEKLYIFTRVSRAGTTAAVTNDYNYLTAKLCFYHDDLIPGALVYVYPETDYIITSITGLKSGNNIPFTSQSGTYTFNMPDESVEITQQYPTKLNLRSFSKAFRSI